MCKTSGQLQAYAGLDPTKTWEKGQKRPWNAELKTLCFKLGESFVKFQNNKDDFYGQLFATRKNQERRKNFNGDFQQQAKDAVKVKNFKKSTDAYKWYSGRYKGHECMLHINGGPEPTLYKEGAGTPMLPPAHIHARARRNAVKMFLSHLHHMMHVDYYGELPQVPFVFAHRNEDGSHTHYLEPPNQDKAIGRPLKELLEGQDTRLD